jgi:hypothetical protein
MPDNRLAAEPCQSIDNPDQGEIKMRKLSLPCLVVLVAFIAAAYLNRWPFQHNATPGGVGTTVAANGGNSECHAYNVFVDPTSSTTDRANYGPEMGKFLARLHGCDRVRVGRIADRTADEAAVLDWTELPVRDPDAGGDDDIVFKQRYQKARRAISDALNGVLHEESPARSTDVLGLFTRLSADPSKINVLVVLSDGLDSSTIENVCISDKSIQFLLEKTAEHLRGHSSSLSGFREVYWVLPTKAGRANCNSLDEQRLFWPTILEAEAGSDKLAVHFDTNPL